jgi:hypothetical protein
MCALSHPQCHSAAGRIMSIKNSNDIIGNGTCDLPACSVVPQQAAPPRSPNCVFVYTYNVQFCHILPIRIIVSRNCQVHRSVSGAINTCCRSILNHNSYVPEGSAQAEFCASRNWACLWSTVHAYTYPDVVRPFAMSEFVIQLIPVAARSNAWICGLSLAEIASWNPATGTDVCPSECCVCVWSRETITFCTCDE